MPLVLLFGVPAAAHAQWDTPNRAFHKTAAFPLEGRHLTVAGASCHIKGVIQGTPTTCYDCHWLRRQDDPYRTRLGSACEQCHRPTAWTAAKWDHGSATGMPLNAAHKTLGCDTCHKNALFSGVTLGCASCHQKEYDATTKPGHRASGFSTDCAGCHKASDSSFEQARFDHASVFPLVGQHAVQDCLTCHVKGVYKGTPRDCLGCHRKDYDTSKTPNHAAAGFSTGCDTCHRPTDTTWHGAKMNHGQFYPLVGLHATVACASCHVNNVYQGTPTDCVGCHRKDYDGSKNPNHASSGFSTACESCHKNTDPSWHSAALNHNQFFALQGVHATQACKACHINNVFKGTPRDCYTCHRTNYEKTSNPNHVAAQFPTTCDSCHKVTDSLWSQGKFSHTWFPITSGRHSGNPCAACHTNPSNFAVFTCLTCHDRTTTDGHHKGKSGYRYDSAACYACHPNGRAG